MVPRGDGLLSHDLLPDEKGPQDACGVFGVWAPGDEVAKLTYFGLYALQHRGQEAAGIAVADDRNVVVYKDVGLVAQVFDESVLQSLQGKLAIGHCRYSTAGGAGWHNAQPTIGRTANGTIALAHNGNLVNTDQLREELARRVSHAASTEADIGNTTDTALITALLSSNIDWLHGDGALSHGGETAAQADIPGSADAARAAALPPNPQHPEPNRAAPGSDQPTLDGTYPEHAQRSVFDTALEVLPLLRGAFCLVFLDETTLYAARDPWGVHPLVIGRLERGWVVASETAALDIIGASYVRDVEPGELIAIDSDGLRTARFAPAQPKTCIFEYVYLARPDTAINGRYMHGARVEMGRRLAREHPVDADVVIPVPESGTPAAVGYAAESGIPYEQGLVKNSYVGRTFIQPSQTIRQLGIRLKLNPLREVIAGKRLVVVDDSIVRGNTQRALIRMLREAGAAEIHVRISSPPVKWPCFYGLDFPTPAELLAHSLPVDRVCASIGADSLGYISLDAMVEASEQQQENLCTACFTGHYPIDIQ